jgi:hypothetical protein
MAGPAGLDVRKEFVEYLARFEELHGEVDFGKFVKHAGRLVKKLHFEDFEPLYREYYEVARTYFDSIDRGDTINDMVVKVLRERATELLITSPV